MTYSVLNFILFFVISALCAIVILALHTYNTGVRHPVTILFLLLSGLIGSAILVKSPKYI